MTPGSDIAVVICTYTEKRWTDLEEAVESVQRQTLEPDEIIVVVDHNPALLERVRASLTVHAVENNEARGLSGARNSGIAAAHSADIVFLDDDAVAEPDWLARLTSQRTDPTVMGSGGALVPWWQAPPPAWFPSEFNWVVGCSYRGMPERTATIRNPLGASMWFRREVFEGVGGFRSGMGREGTHPLGCEETELSIRARQRWPERRFVYEPESRVHHRVPPGRATLGYFRERCWAEGLSKAAVAGWVGQQDGLASERTYTMRTLPQGVLRGLRDAALEGDLGGLGRASAITFGLACTLGGYLRGRRSGAPAPQTSVTTFPRFESRAAL